MITFQMILGPLLNYTITTLGPGTSLCCLSGLMLLGLGSGLCFTIPGNVKTQTQKGQDSSSHQTKDAIKTLLSSPKIYILCFHDFFFAFGLFTTYSYLSSRAIYFEINEEMNGVLLAIIGLTTCVGRVIFGMILDKYRQFSIQITVTALAINSIFVMTSSFFTSLTGQIVFCTVFGLTFGCYPTSTVILLRMTFQDVGLPYSLCFFSTGLSCIICPPIMGLIRDITGSFTGTFLTAGSLSLIGSLLPLLLLPLKRLEVSSNQD